LRLALDGVGNYTDGAGCPSLRNDEPQV